MRYESNLHFEAPFLVTPEKRTDVAMSPYQLRELLQFSGFERHNGHAKAVSYGALGGMLDGEERQRVSDFADWTFDNEITVYVGECNFKKLSRLAFGRGFVGAATVFKKLNKRVDLRIVSKADLDPVTFGKLPNEVQYSVATTGDKTFRQISDFIQAGGLMSVAWFKRPGPAYLEAVEKTPGETIIDKVDMAIYKPTDEVKQASHDFITAQFLPVSSENGNGALAYTLGRYVNGRIDRGIEERYAQVVLTRRLLLKETEGALVAFGLAGASIPLLHMLNEQAPDSPWAQTFIKLVPPIIADLVTFWAQLSPWLKGDTGRERFVDFGKRLGTTHLKSLLLSLGATAGGTRLAVDVGEEWGDVAGAAVYSAIPLAVAGATTWDTYRTLKNRFDLPRGETIRTMFANNPIHLGIDLGALVTFVTGVGVLGYGGQFKNPTATSLIEGVLEHSFAAMYAFMQLSIGQTYSLHRDMHEHVSDWLKRGYLDKLKKRDILNS